MHLLMHALVIHLHHLEISVQTLCPLCLAKADIMILLP